MSKLVKKLNKISRKEHGPVCNKCDLFSRLCRCMHNDPYKNKEVPVLLSKTYTNINNGDEIQGVMEAPIDLLGSDLVQILKHIEMSGYTVAEVLKAINKKYKKK